MNCPFVMRSIRACTRRADNSRLRGGNHDASDADRLGYRCAERRDWATGGALYRGNRTLTNNRSASRLPMTPATKVDSPISRFQITEPQAEISITAPSQQI